MKRPVTQWVFSMIAAALLLNVASFAQKDTKKKWIITEDKKGVMNPGTTVLATVGGDPITL
ncbi:MAG: hypothetical protein ACKO9V_04350, partial [Candidatus Kapaibacterium sp.]